MPIALLSAATFVGLICAAIWVLAGGGWLSAVLVYVLSGNLAIAAILGRILLRDIR